MTTLLEPALFRTLDQLQIITRRTMMGNLQGERRSVRKGISAEFADFRPYVPGDDFRQIDWNLYARMERFFLKLFVAEEELTFHLLIDTSNSMNWGDPNKFHYARQVAGVLGYLVLKNLDRVSVTVVSSSPATSAAHPPLLQLPGVRGRRGVFPLFRFLGQLSVGGNATLEAVCRWFSQTIRTPGPVFLCSDLLDPTWREALRILAARPYDAMVLQILAPQEISPQIEGDVRLVDEEGGETIEVTASPDLLRQYHEHLHRWKGEISTSCRGYEIAYLFTSTATPLEEFVVSHLRKNGIVR